jgi:hypothetical protein
MDYIENEWDYFVNREYSDDDEDAPWIIKLSRATEYEFVKIITLQLQVYNEYWKNFWSLQNLLHELCIKVDERTNFQYTTWLKREESCYEHRVAL